MTIKPRKKLLIVDGNALLHRAWHALPPLTTRDGLLVNAVYGFLMILMKALKDIKPSHVAVTFDKKGPTFRHEAYKKYKATRVKQSDELYDQLPLVKEVMRAFNFSVYELDGFEADDVIGSICELKSIDQPDILSIILTGDMDALQLVDENTEVYGLKKGLSDLKIYDIAAVKEKYDGLAPEQLIDYKALRGDPSDNIPGVRGIGEKGAIQLLQEFGDLETLYKKYDKSKNVKVRTKELLTKYKADAMMSKKLARIIRNAPVEFKLSDAAVRGFDQEELLRLFQKFEFRTMMGKIPELEKALGVQKQATLFRAETVADVSKNTRYELVDTPAKLKKLVAALTKQKIFAFDTETTALNVMEAELLGVAISWRVGEAFYVTANEGSVKALKPMLEKANVKKVGHNLKYDLAVMKRAGVTVKGTFFDTMIASYLLRPGSRSHKLDTAVFTEFGHQMIPIEALIGKSGKNQLNMSEVSVAAVAEYAGEDADFTWRLYERLASALRKQKLTELFTTMEMPLIEVLMSMEMNGVKIDAKFLSTFSKELAKKIKDKERQIYQFAGQEFNINSPSQLKDVLFDVLELPTFEVKKTKTGLSTAAGELEKLRAYHPIIDEISEYREYAKLQSTYVTALPALVNRETGRVHTSFNQTVAATGRLSSSDPNLQNIPIRTELGREIRKAFIAERDMVLVAADYSQIELRIVASLAGDQKMIKAFKNHEDIHAWTAAEINDVPLDQVTPQMRREAKAVNFGIVYGQGAYGLAAGTGISRQAAREFIDKYFVAHAEIKRYLDDIKEHARTKGYVETMFGRRRFFPEINSNVREIRLAAERAAINMPIQGTAADMIKLAMIKLHAELPKKFPRVKMILQVHDELVFEAPSAEAASLAAYVKDVMSEVIKFKVPIEVNVAVGRNWGELEPVL